MDDLRELYQEVILDHGRHPRHFGEPPAANRKAEGFNPLCGDHVTVFLDLEENRIVRCSFSGNGCAICIASASLMSEAVSGGTELMARTLAGDFRAFMTASNGDGAAKQTSLGKLCVLAGVKNYPMRVKCATLPWHTLVAALDSMDEVVTTE